MVDHLVSIGCTIIAFCFAMRFVTSCRDVFLTVQSLDVRECSLFCQRDSRCATYYFKGSASGRSTCSLSEFGLQISPAYQELSDVLTRIRDDGPWNEQTAQQIRPSFKNNKDCNQDKTTSITSPDYCASEKHNCSINANCTSAPGTFTCSCRDGYKGDGVICDRVCSSGWQLFGGSCYHMYADTKSWQDSSLTCQSNKANLVSITSLEENTFVHSLTTAGAAVWIGLVRSGLHPSLAWSDGSTLGYNNWYNREPDKSGNCVYMRVRDRKWRDWSCSTSLPFICKY